MATIDASLKDVLDSLDLEKVPEKLKCTHCHNFNVSPYKTSCCDVLICESCFNNYRDSSCPKCDHKPFTDDICKPNKAMQKTVKGWLKNQEKAKPDGRDKADGQEDSAVQPNTDRPSVNGDSQADGVVIAVTEEEQLPLDAAENEDTPAADVQPSVEEPDHEVVDNDDDIEFQVELEDDHQQLPTQRPKSTEDTPQPQSETSFENKSQLQELPPSNNDPDGMNGVDFSNTMGGFNNMDMNQMMQMAQASGMPFNPMMAMTMMGMNQMSGMLGNFGGQNGGMNMNMNGMNGMNMGMNFNPNQGMYGWNGQNNNMWQNNNGNAFPNGMGNDFGSNYGFNMDQSGSFQQAYPSNDFQSGYYGRGYGRGRGRGRGGFGRGRGNFNQYSQYHQQQGYQNGPGPKQFDNRNMQSQVMHNDSHDPSVDQGREENNDVVDESHEDDEFAPGGQEEVQEALGEDYQKSTAVEKTTTPEVSVVGDCDIKEEPEPLQQEDAPDVDKVTESARTDEPESVGQEGSEPVTTAPPEKPIPEAYNEDLQGSMAPPSAPLGPSAQYGDYGFRSRGHGRFSSRGRGLMSMPNGHIASSVKPFSPAPLPTEPKGAGVVGAPTGPRAMREPPALARPASRSAATGFQIMGRASMAAPSRSESRDVDRSRSKSPDRDSRAKDQSRLQSGQDKYGNPRYEAAEQEAVEFRDQDKRSRKPSKRDTYDDYDKDGREGSYPQSESADFKSSSRRSRSEKDRRSKHSSRSRRDHDEDANGDYEMDEYEDSARSSRDAHGESRTKHRSSKSSKYDDRERDRDRDRDRDHEKQRDKDREKDRDREDRHRDRDRDHRKRSRQDRHRDDNADKQYDYDYDYDYEQPEEADEEQESRHRSRRHKKDHRRDTEEHNGTSNSMVNGSHSQSHLSSATATPAPAQSTSTSTPVEEKDPIPWNVKPEIANACSKNNNAAKRPPRHQVQPPEPQA